MLLILLGIAGYVVSGAVSITALIPAFFGIIFVLLGQLAEKESLRKHVMHIAVLIALLGLVGSLMGGIDIFTLAGISRSLMALLCIVYIVLAVKSFIDARRTTA